MEFLRGTDHGVEGVVHRLELFRQGVLFGILVELDIDFYFIFIEIFVRPKQWENFAIGVVKYKQDLISGGEKC